MLFQWATFVKVSRPFRFCIFFVSLKKRRGSIEPTQISVPRIMQTRKLINVLCVVGLVLSRIYQESLPQPQLSFVCPPIKASQLKSQKSQANHTCVNFDVQESSTSTVLFSITVTDFLDSSTDVSRLGPTSCELGRQHLDFTVMASDGGLVRSHRNLKSGRTVIQLHRSVRGSHFEFCFLNVVYDSSWRSIDMQKGITLSVINKETVKPHLSDRMCEEAIDALKSSANILFSLVNEESGQELGRLEGQRRDFNENTFSWLLKAQVLLPLVAVIATLLSAHALVSYQWSVTTSSIQKSS
ncbi:LAFA_0G08856g1_1 [Lachancea sp. 'fantastica']|nr:LAFA_0G08856g1_1 [Lachancea sp. 'fantastica']